MEKKYEMIEEEGTNLFRIIALRDFGNVNKGDWGGLIEKEYNLSHYDNAWVYINAKVYGSATVWDDAKVWGCAEVYGNARVTGKGSVSGNAKIYVNAEVRGRVYGNAEVYGSAIVYSNAKVRDDARVCGNTEVCGDAKICGNAEVHGDDEYLTISPIGSEEGVFTAYRTKDGGIGCNRGCFSGTLEEFKAAVKKTHGNNRYAQEYKLVIALVKKRIKPATKEEK